jgi:hypothetical protein
MNRRQRRRVWGLEEITLDYILGIKKPKEIGGNSNWIIYLTLDEEEPSDTPGSPT